MMDDAHMETVQLIFLDVIFGHLANDGWQTTDDGHMEM